MSISKEEGNVRSDIKRLSLYKAGEIIAALNKELCEWGWILAIFGSTLNGWGNDVDLIAFNRTDNTRIEDLDEFFKMHHFKILKGQDNEASSCRIYEYHSKNQFIRFDVHIRYTRGENWLD